jgi:outer membrane protein assembly factor BamB
VHITVSCPSCHSKYQLEPALIGQRMRCPNPICREVFEVRADQTPPEPPPEIYPFESPKKPASTPPPGPRKTGKTASISDVVPLLDASVTQPPPAPATDPKTDKDQAGTTSPAPPPKVASWQEEPPAQRIASWREEPPVKRSGELPAAPGRSDSGDRLPSASPPPKQVTRQDPSRPSSETKPPEKAPAADFVPPDAEPTQRELDSLETVTPPRSRKALWLSFAMVGCVVLIAGGVVTVFFNEFVNAERKLREQAFKDLQEGRWSSAKVDFKNLVEKFPKSEHSHEYEFLLDLCTIGDDATSSLQSAPLEVADRLRNFVTQKTKDPLFKENRKYVASLFVALAQKFIEPTENLTEVASLDQGTNSLKEARKLLKEAQELGADAGQVKEVAAKLEAQEQQIALRIRRQKTVDLVKTVIKDGPTPDSIRRARDYVRREGFGGDQEIGQWLTQAETMLRLEIRYVEVNEPAAASHSEKIEPGLLVTPLLAGSPPAKGAVKRVVLALDRGVLYALDEASGKDLWAVRVGIDTTALPVRLPKTPLSPERFLVLSADRNTLMALAAEDGSVAWRRTLASPCLGRPAVDAASQRAYVPTYNGRVNEIELNGGVLLGYYDLEKLKEHLSLGAVLQDSTDCLFVPGDSENVYVFDTARTQDPGKPARKKACVAIIPTGHPSGSLRSEPLVLQRVNPRQQPALGTPAPGYLVLCQTDGFEQMKLRVFNLPPESGEGQTIQDKQIGGWSWFEPCHDSEKLAFVTDAGYVGIFGINQPGNEDEAVFPLNREPIRLGSNDSHLVRGQVVHAQDNDFWIVAGGRLQRYYFDVFARGPQMRQSPVWPSDGVATGSPIHTGQMDEANSILVTVTRDLARQVTLATAVDSNKGKVLWQRQLGIESQGDPVALGNATLLVDRSGAILLLDGASHRGPTAGGWQISDSLLAVPIEGLVPGSMQILPDGTGAVHQVAVVTQASNQGNKLVVRTIKAAAEGQKPTVQESSIDLISLPQGSGAIVNGTLVLPLADESLHQFKLPLEPGGNRGGPTWRSRQADDDARGHVVSLQGDDFLFTDGSRGLTRCTWPAMQNWKSQPVKELPVRIVTAPLVQPGSEKSPSRIWVAQAQGAVTVLNGATLATEKSWQLPGKVTAGPFARGSQVFTIVDRKKLVCLDPAKSAIAWQYEMPGNDIVGEPGLVDGMLIVASPKGRFVGLDPANGLPRGPGYVLTASAAPSGSPALSGADRALVPLTDGTVFFLLPNLLLDQQAAAKGP